MLKVLSSSFFLRPDFIRQIRTDAMPSEFPKVTDADADLLRQPSLHNYVGVHENTGVSVVAVSTFSSDNSAGWHDYVAQSPDATVFHELGWMAAVRDVYRHRPHYLVARDSDSTRLSGILPLFEVRGPFTGHALISTPYAVNGGILSDHPGAEIALLQAAQALAQHLKVRYLEIRKPCGHLGLAEKSHHFAFRKTMPQSPAEVLPCFPRKARAAIRHAIDRHKLTTQFGPHLLAVFHRLYVASLRRLGSPPHRKWFFQRLLEEYGNRCWVQIVYQGDTPVAGVISLQFKDQILPYFAGIDEQYSRLNTSNFMYYSLMEQAVGAGLRVFDFGRTRQDNVGGCEFKTNQGFEPEPMTYSFYSPSNLAPPDLRPSNSKFSLAQAVWRRMPLSSVEFVGGVVTRWLP